MVTLNLPKAKLPQIALPKLSLPKLRLPGRGKPVDVLPRMRAADQDGPDDGAGSARTEPKRAGPGSLLRRPAVGLAAAGVVFAGAIAALALLLGPVGEGSAPELRIPIAGVLKAAPPEWRAALHAGGGAVRTVAQVIQLSERPQAGAPATRPQAAQAFAYDGPGLPQAPIEGLYVDSPTGPLPVISPSGRTPAEAYAKPFISSGRPKVAIVVGGLGMNPAMTRQALDTLPPQVTLSFVVYAPDLQSWIDQARARGHEVLLEAPLEPENFPENDAGPYTLMTTAAPEELTRRLEWVLTRGAGYFGLINAQGGRFLASDPAYQAFSSALRARGLAFIDDGRAAARAGGIPRASADRVLDRDVSAAGIARELNGLEAAAEQKGQALATAYVYPVTLQKVAEWARDVEQRGFQLAPASALTVKR